MEPCIALLADEARSARLKKDREVFEKAIQVLEKGAPSSSTNETPVQRRERLWREGVAAKNNPSERFALWRASADAVTQPSLKRAGILHALAMEYKRNGQPTKAFETYLEAGEAVPIGNREIGYIDEIHSNYRAALALPSSQEERTRAIDAYVERVLGWHQGTAEGQKEERRILREYGEGGKKEVTPAPKKKATPQDRKALEAEAEQAKKKGDHARAKALYLQAADLASGKTQVRSGLYAMAGHSTSGEEAARLFLRSIEVLPNDPTGKFKDLIRERYGDAIHAVRLAGGPTNRKRALELYDQLFAYLDAAYAPNDPEKRKAIEQANRQKASIVV